MAVLEPWLAVIAEVMAGKIALIAMVQERIPIPENTKSVLRATEKVLQNVISVMVAAHNVVMPAVAQVNDNASSHFLIFSFSII